MKPKIIVVLIHGHPVPLFSYDYSEPMLTAVRERLPDGWYAEVW